MKGLRSIGRKLLWTLLVLLVVLLGLVVALPVWFPWLLKPLAQRAGVSYQSFERRGYNHGTVNGAQAQFGTTHIQAQRIEMRLPPAWLWRHWFGDPGTEPCVQVRDWRLEVASKSPQAANDIDSTGALLEVIDAEAAQWRRWLPSARFTNGVIHAGQRVISVPDATWNSGILTATAKSPDLTPTLRLRGELNTRGEVVLETELDPWGVRGRLVVKRQTPDWAATGEISWRTNRANITARLGHRDWWPEEAQFRLASFRLPSDLLGLKGYSSLGGSVALNWQTNRFSLSLHSTATPEKSDRLETPPLEVTADAHGNKASLVLDRLLITAPPVRGELASPIGFDWQDPAVLPPANLALHLDLSRLKLTGVTGQLTGTLRAEPRRSNLPSLKADLRGTHVFLAGLSVQEAGLKGRLDWPELVLEQGRLQLSDGSVFTANASLNLNTTLLTNAQWQITGGAIREWLSPNLGYATLQATGQLSGLLTQPHHQGAATATGFHAPSLHPCDLRLAWEGEGLVFSRTELALVRGDVQLQAGGSWRVPSGDGLQIEGTFERLDWRRRGRVVYHLEPPCQWAVSRKPDGSPPGAWQVKFTPLRWRSQDSTVMLSGASTWPRTGEGQIHAQNLALAEFEDLFNLPAGDLSVEKFDFETHWADGPVEFKLDVTGGVPGPDGAPWSLAASIAGDARGVALQPLTVRTKSSIGLTITGRVPLSLAPANSGLRARFDPEEPFDLRATNSPLARVAQSIGKWGELTLEQPLLELSLTGNMTKPQGKIRLQLERLDWAPRTNTMFVPRLDQLNLDVRLDREALRVEAFSMLLNGQSVSASGELPLQAGFWADLLANGAMPDWTRSRGHLAVKDAALPALTAFLPDKTITEGRIDLALAWGPGPKIQGQVMLNQAATGPIEPLGPIRDLNATLKLENRTATVEHLVATVGGARLKGAGWVSFDEQFKPQFDFTLQGTNVPLVRTVGLIIRSDVDLRLLSTGARPPTLSGQLRLRDSLYLQDLDLSALGPDAQATWLPSHLRIGQMPFKDWTLDVNVSGVQFLRLRTPILTGAVSANFHLENNLGDPLAIGQASLASGRITFPFGALNIDSGFVYLSHEAAQRPRLAVNASGTCYGYAIKVEITGSTAAPEVLFSSTPPLGSSQILSLLTSGQLPGDTGVLNRTARAERLAMFLGNDVVSRFLGNEPVQERLTINSGQRISQSGKATYSVEYRLNNHWSLVGEYDQFDTLNAHVKWKIYSK